MGGALTAQSDGVGKGTTLDFTIPLQHVEAGTAGVGSQPSSSNSVDSPLRLQLRNYSSRSVNPVTVEELEALPTANASPRGSAGAPVLRALVAEDDRLSQVLMVRVLRCRCHSRADVLRLLWCRAAPAVAADGLHNDHRG